ncbi:MAG: acyl-CoA desaturase [Bernardetiaceae bacterium]|jgi:linoleoyl-CoA desaturase|nr:acyl-CoA desaturase [Bernardetiaceae bacterium]
MNQTASKTPKFIERQKTGFYNTLRKRVDAYFIENQISKHANGLMVFKTVLFMGGFLGLYLVILLGNLSPAVSLLLATVLGVFGAMVGFNVSHDAIHGAYSSRRWVNQLISFSFNIIGASPYVWKLTHNLVHHTYTNIPGHDEDIDVAPGMVRLSPDDKLNYAQRFQHYYAFLLYGLASVSWVLRKDFKKFFQKQIGNHVNKHPRIEYVKLFGFKAMYYVMFIVLPLVVMPISFGQWVLGFLVMHLAQGLVLGLVFQLAHVVEDCAFPAPNAEGNIEEAWAVHQMQTTANFGRKSWFTNFFCGGLNMQVEHHLFPTVCHVHYGAISDIVKNTAEEFGVPYLENTSFWTALQSHYRMLRRLGADEWDLRHGLSQAKVA